MRGDRLDYAAEQFWATPRASDGEKGGPNQSFGAGGTPLSSQATIWATPRTVSGAYTRDSGDSAKQRLTMEGQALAFSLPVLTTVKTGKPRSSERRSLNPLFVEWMMGWPLGWTLLVSTDFGCSETALSRWRWGMRCALWRMPLPDVPAAQLALFG